MSEQKRKSKKNLLQDLDQMSLKEEVDVTATSIKESVKVEYNDAKQKGPDGEKVEPVVLKDETNEVEKKFMSKNLGWISTEYGHTINMGNYESVKISIRLTMPIGILLDDESRKDIDDTFNSMDSYLTNRFSQEIKKVIEYRDSRNKK